MLVVSILLGSCEYDYGAYRVSAAVGSPSGSLSVGWSSAQYDVNGFPIFGYMGGRPVYGYTPAGVAVFNFGSLTPVCYVPRWNPAPWYRGSWVWPRHIHRGVPPRIPAGHYPGGHAPRPHVAPPRPRPPHVSPGVRPPHVVSPGVRPPHVVSPGARPPRMISPGASRQPWRAPGIAPPRVSAPGAATEARRHPHSFPNRQVSVERPRHSAGASGRPHRSDRHFSGRSHRGGSGFHR